MGVYAINGASLQGGGNINDDVCVHISKFFVGIGASGPVFIEDLLEVVTILPRMPHQFHWLAVGVDNNGANTGVHVCDPNTPPARDIWRWIGAWGTTPDETTLMKQIMRGNRAYFSGDYDGFDPDLQNFGQVVQNRSLVKFVPVGLVGALLLRVEGTRIDQDGAAQINIAREVVESPPSFGSQAHPTQVHGFVKKDQRMARRDDMEIPVVLNGNTYGVANFNSHMQGYIHASGWIMRSDV